MKKTSKFYVKKYFGPKLASDPTIEAEHLRAESSRRDASI